MEYTCTSLCNVTQNCNMGYTTVVSNRTKLLNQGANKNADTEMDIKRCPE